MALRFFKTYGRFPVNFYQWDLQCFGKPLPFKMVELGIRLDGFDRWHMTHDNINIAMYAGAYGLLPDNFDQWDISTEDGVTVALICLIKDTLPDHFDKEQQQNLFGFDINISEFK